MFFSTLICSSLPMENTDACVFRHHFLSAKIQIFPKLEVRAENSLLLNHHIRGDQPAGRGRYELCPRMALRTALGTALARVGLRSDDEHTIMIIMPGM